jgi:hypothetical protein
MSSNDWLQCSHGSDALGVHPKGMIRDYPYLVARARGRTTNPRMDMAQKSQAMAQETCGHKAGR